jgi:hypothetical protein
MMMDKKTLTILGVIIGVIAIAVGIYFYVSREHMVCELITNSDYIRKNFRSMMDSPQIIRPQARIRSLMGSSGLSGNYILLALNFSNPIASNFSVDIIGDNNAVLYKSKSVTQDINGSLVLFEADNIDSTKIRYFRLNNFDSNQNRVTRVVFGKYENGNMSLDAASRCFVQYEPSTRSTNVVPMFSTGIQSIRFLAKNKGEIGQVTVKGDYNADVTSSTISSNGVSNLQNLFDGTRSDTQANISANGSFTFNTLRQGRQLLSYVDEIILRNVSGLFPLIISFNYGKYIFDLVYNPNIILDAYRIKADSMTPVYDYDINALRISFNSILTGSSPIPAPTPVPTPPEPVKCDKTNFRVIEASSCDNINGVWKRKQSIDYQDDLCQDESRYVDCPANMIPQPTPPQPEPQPIPPQPSVCPIDVAGLTNLRNTISNLENMMRQKDTTISDLRNQLSSQTCPPQQSCPVTQEQYNQAINQFNIIQNQLQEKIREYNTLQDDLRNNYISKSTYQQHASQCVREIETLKAQLKECESKINTLPPQPSPVPTPSKTQSVFLDQFVNIINNGDIDAMINYLQIFYKEQLQNNTNINIENIQEDSSITQSGELFLSSKCQVIPGFTIPEYSLCNSRTRINLLANAGYIDVDSLIIDDNKYAKLFKIICLIGYAYVIYKIKGSRVLSLFRDTDNFGFALFILSIRNSDAIMLSNTEPVSVSKMFNDIFIQKRTDLWKQAITHMNSAYNSDDMLVKNFYNSLRSSGFKLLKLIYGSYILPVPTADEIFSYIPDNVYYISLLIGGEGASGLGESINNIKDNIRNDSFVIHYYNEKYSSYNRIPYNYAFVFGIVKNDNYNNELETKINNINGLVAYKFENVYNKIMYGNSKLKLLESINYNFATKPYNYKQVDTPTQLTAEEYIMEANSVQVPLITMTMTS